MLFPHLGAETILPASALLLALLLLLFRLMTVRRRTERRIRTDMLSVLPALERSAAGDDRELTAWLRRAARRYPDEVRSFILLGDLLRRESPLKASFLHRTLLYRKKLTDGDKAAILLSLGRDQRALGDEQKALASFKQSLAAGKRADTLRELVDLELRLGLYDDALFHRKEWNKLAAVDRSDGLREIMLDAVAAAVAQGRREEVRRWVELAVRHEGETPLARLLTIFAAAFEGDTTQVTTAGVDFLERHPDEELTLRYLLTTVPGVAATAHEIPGPWAPVFAALADPARPLSPQEKTIVDKKTVLYYHLSARAFSPGESRELVAAVGGRDRFFVCGACARPLAGPVFSCPGCGLPLTVKPGTI